ncbi:MAG: hypothetical protein R2941_07085 [Desulfobacterales bacterium]
MRITALGGGSAFATGTYEEAVPAEKVGEIVKALAGRAENLTGLELAEEIAKNNRKIYNPKWHSNFLVEFETSGKREKVAYRLLLDAGRRYSSFHQTGGLSSADIDGIYIYPHNITSAE